MDLFIHSKTGKHTLQKVDLDKLDKIAKSCDCQLAYNEHTNGNLDNIEFSWGEGAYELTFEIYDKNTGDEENDAYYYGYWIDISPTMDFEQINNCYLIIENVCNTFSYLFDDPQVNKENINPSELKKYRYTTTEIASNKKEIEARKTLDENTRKKRLLNEEYKKEIFVVTAYLLDISPKEFEGKYKENNFFKVVKDITKLKNNNIKIEIDNKTNRAYEYEGMKKSRADKLLDLLSEESPVIKVTCTEDWNYIDYFYKRQKIAFIIFNYTDNYNSFYNEPLTGEDIETHTKLKEIFDINALELAKITKKEEYDWEVFLKKVLSASHIDENN